MSRAFFVWFSPLLLVPALAVGGCSAGTATDGNGSSSAPGTGTASSAAAVPQSPLKPYLDVLYNRLSDEDELQAQLASESAIAECMADKGFDYTPRGEAYWKAERALNQPGGGEEGIVSREWVAQNGYGINTSKADAMAQLRAADPNSRYVAGLSQAEQKAYQLALNGDQNGGGADTGCTGGADGGSQPLSLSKRWAPLVASLQQMWDKLIPAEPDTIAANRDWSECMANAGYPDLSRPDDAPELAATRSQGPAGAAPAGGSGDPKALAAEIEIALADYDCRTTTDYLERIHTVQIAAETAFLSQNRTQLDALLAEREQGR